MRAERRWEELKQWFEAYREQNPTGNPFVGRALDKMAELEAAEELKCGWCEELHPHGYLGPDDVWPRGIMKWGCFYGAKPGLFSDRDFDAPVCSNFRDCRQTTRRKADR